MGKRVENFVYVKKLQTHVKFNKKNKIQKYLKIKLATT